MQVTRDVANVARSRRPIELYFNINHQQHRLGSRRREARNSSFECRPAQLSCGINVTNQPNEYPDVIPGSRTWYGCTNSVICDPVNVGDTCMFSQFQDTKMAIIADDRDSNRSVTITVPPYCPSNSRTLYHSRQPNDWTLRLIVLPLDWIRFCFRIAALCDYSYLLSITILIIDHAGRWVRSVGIYSYSIVLYTFLMHVQYFSLFWRQCWPSTKYRSSPDLRKPLSADKWYYIHSDRQQSICS